MYLPKAFGEHDPALIRQVMRDFPLATVITQAEGRPFVSHLPLSVHGEAELVLSGHMAMANPQWRHFATGEVLAIFNGPNAYIPSSWYGGVPTWNYAVVHVIGHAELIEEADALEELLQNAARQFEGRALDRIPRDLFKDIVGFRITPTHVQPKFKLSQNRTPEEREHVMTGLGNQKIVDLMRKVFNPRY